MLLFGTVCSGPGFRWRYGREDERGGCLHEAETSFDLGETTRSRRLWNGRQGGDADRITEYCVRINRKQDRHGCVHHATGIGMFRCCKAT